MAESRGQDQGAGAVLRSEWALLRAHRRLLLAFAGLLFVPAVYAFIYLSSVWDPAAHASALPAGLVVLDAGARYRERDVNLGAEVAAAIERRGGFAWRRYVDREAARRDVRLGVIDFVLEIPADFSRRALPGAEPGDGKLTIYTSEGNDYVGAGFARRFAPEVAQRVNTMLGEARWELVLTTAAGSRRELDTLRQVLADLHEGAVAVAAGAQQAGDGAAALGRGVATASDGAQALRAGAATLADGVGQTAATARQAGSVLRALDARRPADAELAALRQGSQGLVQGQRELARAFDTAVPGAQQLAGGLGRLREAADELPLVGGSLVEAIDPLHAGARQLAVGLGEMRDGQGRLLQGTLRLDEGVAQLVDGQQRAGQAVAGLVSRWPEDARLDALAEGSREAARGADALAGGLLPLGAGATRLSSGMATLGEGARHLAGGLELVRQSLPGAVDAPEGSPRGLAASVEPVVEVVAPVSSHGAALTPNFVPLALWVGAVMAAFVVSLRRVPQALAGTPRLALAAGKLALPAAAVLLQAALMLAMLGLVLRVPMVSPWLFALTLASASLAFLAIVFALVRVLGALGKVLAVLLLVVQVSAAGAVLPIQLSDEAFQAMHPYLPLTWVVRAFRASLFDAYDGAFWPAWGVVAAIGLGALAIGIVAGRWRFVSPAEWRPPLELD